GLASATGASAGSDVFGALDGLNPYSAAFSSAVLATGMLARALISSTTLSTLGSVGLMAPLGLGPVGVMVLNSRRISSVVFFNGAEMELRRFRTSSRPVERLISRWNSLP